MATSVTRRLQRRSLSSKRAQQSIKSLEAQLGITISSDTSDNSSSQETLSERELGDDNERSLDKAD